MHHKYALIMSLGLLANGCLQDEQLQETEQHGDSTLDHTSSVAGGKTFTCAKDWRAIVVTPPGGLIYCWGDNSYGQLGQGDFVSRTTPTQVSSLPTIPNVANNKNIKAGGYHACALRYAAVNDYGNSLYCWGRNDSGQVGDGTYIDRNLPVKVIDGANYNVREVTLGDYHTCAEVIYKSDGKKRLRCWGKNASGQLGLGNYIDVNVPTSVTFFSLNTVINTSAGGDHTCAMSSATNKTYCWGLNDHGQLGDNTHITRNLPVQVTPIAGVTLLRTYLGVNHTCAVGSTSTYTTMYCWGDNDKGQLGDGTFIERTIPTKVSYPTGGTSWSFGQASLGLEHTCASRTNYPGQPNVQELLCWGNNASGQLGQGNYLNKNVPTLTYTYPNNGSNTGSKWFGLGDNHSCLLDFAPVPAGNGSFYFRCFGMNAYGQVGDGTLADRNTPIVVLSGTNH